MDIINVKSVPFLENSIIKKEYHAYTPYTNSLGFNDEIRISINYLDAFILPATSYLSAELELDENSELDAITLSNNFLLSFLKKHELNYLVYQSVNREILEFYLQ